MRLFKRKKYKINDPDFGLMTALKFDNNIFRWTTETELSGFDEEFGMLIIGDESGPSEEGKDYIFEFIEKYFEHEEIIRKVLLDTLKNADDKAKLERWQDKFKLFGFDVYEVSGPVIKMSISFNQKEKPFYIFNVHFENFDPVGVSMDS
jgi:hypothetical protein